MLSVTRLNVHYGKIHAVRDAGFRVGRSEIVSIVGANGAGKSTIMWTLAGVLKPSSGEILFDGKPLPGKPHEIVRNGLALVPERRRLFADLTVQENLIMGAYLRRDQAISEDLEKNFALFPILKQRLKQYAGTLSGGEQQMLAIARAMMSSPRMILFDEPSLGLAPIVVDTLMETIQQLRASGMTVLLVEQNAGRALEISDRAYVLEVGRITKEGPGKELLKDPDVRRAYLGELA
ncbi:MAG: ABC transporter ATP-binding protein [Synergistaceae bacterium]|jgi:branched-chain amino acid transport system ATP-binding protein|nr:ABC transporter ATP-binding protein [Synergistaceae bacterium]